MLPASCIFWVSLLSSFSPLGAAMLNLSLPGQHPDPESVVQDVHWRVNVSLSRRQTLSTTILDQVVDSCLTGNPIDDCWRCDPQWHLNRQRLADCGIGFGQRALGGKGGRYYVVTDSSDHDAVNPRPGTLRHAVIQDEPLWIVFSSNMLIRLSQELIFNSFKTLDGRGVNVHIVGGGCITLQYISNVIIHNIHIHHCYQSGNAMVRSSPSHYGWRTLSDGDGISIFGSHDIWIDHCSLSHCKDGLIDAVMGSTGITISNNFFSHHNEVMLLGHSDDYLPDTGMQVTIAFNHFGRKLIQRMPRCRRGYIHVVNNDFTRWEMYAIGGSGNPTINSQGNRYIAPSNPYAKEVTKRVDTEVGNWKDWNWRSEGDVMVNGAYFVASGAGAEVKYEKAYSIEPKSATFINQITMNAGVLGGRSNKLSKWTNNGGGGVDGGDGMILGSESEEEESDEIMWSNARLRPCSGSIAFSVLAALSSALFLYLATISSVKL
ncbi:Pectate lyase [Bertholletia excelsa]